MNWKPLPEHHRRRLDLHAHLLKQHRPDFLSVLGNLREHAHHLEIIEEDGNLLAVRSNANEGIRTMLPQEQGSVLVQQQRTALQTPFERGARFFVLSGIGVGHSLLIAQSLANQQSSMGVVAWDFDLHAWTAFFALFDARRIIEETGRFFLLTGETVHQFTDDLVKERRLFLFPSSNTAYLLGALPVAPKYTERYVEQAKSFAQYIREESNRFESVLSSSLDRLKEPQTEQPRSVWSCTQSESYVHFPIARAFLDGFAQCGLSTHLEPFDGTFGRTFQALGDFFERSPDLLFTINIWPTALLYDLGLPTETIDSMNAPRACWMVDDTLLYEDRGPMAQLGPNDYILCCDRTYLRRLQDIPCYSAFMPPATFFDKPGQARDEYAAPISYVGSLPNVQPFLARLPEACREILERVEAARRNDFNQSFRSLLDGLHPTAAQREALSNEAKSFCGTTHKGFTDPNAELEYFLYNAATYFKRLQTVEAFLPLGLKVFGPSSWLDALEPQYKERYGGFIDNKDLADCYASSKICLNIHSHQCPTCLNARDFDVPMAGSVLLGDWVEDAEGGFLEPGGDILIYKSLDEAVDTAERHLRDLDALQTIRTQGQQRVRNEHTYVHRAQTILDAIAST